MCVRRTIGIRHVSKKGTKLMSKTTWQEAFATSPRLKAIEGVFALIEKSTATTNEIWKKANEVTQTLNAVEREKLPGFVKAELADREPVTTSPPPMR
jgi:hypothetical protein